MINGIYKYLLKKTKSIPYPRYLQLEPTTYCNQDCKICMRKYKDKLPRHLTFLQFSRIIDEVKPKILELSGLGEPFMNHDIFEMFTYARNKGIFISTTTNGILLKNLVDKIIMKPPHLIKISVDSLSCDIFDNIRTRGSFNDLLSSLKAISDNKKYLSEKCSLVMQTVVGEKNISHIEDMIGQISEVGFSKILFKWQEVISLENPRFFADTLKDTNTKRYLIKLKNILSKHKVASNIDWLIGIMHKHIESIEKPSVNFYKDCIMPWFGVFISVDGCIYPCCKFIFTKGEGQHIGCYNVDSTDFYSAYNNRQYSAFREQIIRKKGINSICSKCVPISAFDMLKNSVSRINIKQAYK